MRGRLDRCDEYFAGALLRLLLLAEAAHECVLQAACCRVMFFVSAWLLLIFADMTASEVGIKAFRYTTSMGGHDRAVAGDRSSGGRNRRVTRLRAGQAGHIGRGRRPSRRHRDPLSSFDLKKSAAAGG